MQHADRLTLVSNAQKEMVKKLGLDEANLTVIHNGVDFERFKIYDKKECRRIFDFSSDIKIILFIGQLIDVKGFEYLIQAISKLQKEEANFKVVAIGEGALRQKLENLTRQLHLGEYIVFMGEKPYAEISYWFGASDVFCLPSIREGCPAVIMEALASGRPVVASRVGGIPELIKETNGILVEPRDVQGLCQALKTALNKKWEENKIRDSVTGYSWSNVAERYLGVFRETLFRAPVPKHY